MNGSILELIARVIDWCEPPRDDGPGHPPAETVRVLATLRQFLREGMPWRSLTAPWARSGVLRHAHSMLVGLMRGQPGLASDLIVDSSSVRAKRGGDPTGPTLRSPSTCCACGTVNQRGRVAHPQPRCRLWQPRVGRGT